MSNSAAFYNGLYALERCRLGLPALNGVRPGDKPYGQPQPPLGHQSPLRGFRELRAEKDPLRRSWMLRIILTGKPF